MRCNRALYFTVFITAFIFSFCSTAFAAKKHKAKGYSVSAKAAILYDVTKGKTRYAKNIHGKVLPASTAKVMTVLLVLENLPMDRVVTISARAARSQPSKIYANPGEHFKVRDLLYALLLNSANDASMALAEAVAGSEEKFVRMMNKRAARLGARQTRFTNSSGLPSPSGQYTTAYDMARIFQAAMKNDFFRQTVKYRYKTISSEEGRKIGLKSHNKILFNSWKHKAYGKTGYTRAARACFVGYVSKGKNIYIVGVFGCKRRWMDIKYIVSKYGGIVL